MRLNIALAPLTALLVSSGAAWATDYYAAPLGTTPGCTPDGSQACPWIGAWDGLNRMLTLGGDRLLLLDGEYGGLDLYNFGFDHPVTVQSLNGKAAHFEYLTIKDGSKNLTFKDLSVWPSNPHNRTNPVVSAFGATSAITLDGLDVRSGADAGNYMTWSKDEWTARYTSGVELQGPNSVLKNSRLTGLYMGAVIYNKNSAMLNNVVDGFSGDAYRVVGDDSVVSGNTATNCFQIDTNHSDGLQSWSYSDPDGVISGLTITNNAFLEWNSPQTNALRCSLEGIFFGDGPYQNITIQNNLISVTQYHGISVYGGQGVKIINNTVVNARGLEGIAPWIGIFNQAGRAPAQGITVANNLEMSFHDEVGSPGVTYMNNSALIGLANLFPGLANFDYRPSAVSGFIDTGAVAYAPAIDILSAPRPFGAGPDRGAYEVGSTAPTGTTSGTTSGGTTSGTTSGGTTSGGTTDGGTGTPTSKWGKFLKPPSKWRG